MNVQCEDSLVGREKLSFRKSGPHQKTSKKRYFYLFFKNVHLIFSSQNYIKMALNTLKLP
jgi:hypothetical protein